MADEIIVFDVKGEWAHFKRPYTTTSPLTFDLPSPPTVIGLLGAILGIDRKNYLRELGKRCRVSVALKQSPQKLKTGLKFLHTKNSFRGDHKTPHALIEAELLCNIALRLFCLLDDELQKRALTERLREHCPHYIPALGLAWCLADCEWIDKYPATRVMPEHEIAVHGWLPQSAIAEPTLEPDMRYHMMTLPITMEPDRRVTRYDDIIYEHSGNSIRCRLKPGEDVWQIQHGRTLAEEEASYVYLL